MKRGRYLEKINIEDLTEADLLALLKKKRDEKRAEREAMIRGGESMVFTFNKKKKKKLKRGFRLSTGGR